MSLPVREFIRQSYRLISASSPTVPLHGDDQSMGLRILNQLIKAYSATGLMLTIAKTVEYALPSGKENVIVGGANVTPTPDITEGRLANLDSAWLELQGMTYPLIDVSRDQFFASYKYDPLSGLPRFIIVLPNTDTVTLRIFPSASQQYALFLRGKFEPANLTANDDMSGFPEYFIRFALLALARDMAMYKGRMEAWTQPLEARYIESKQDMESASEVNLSIVGATESLLNGAWRVRAGV